MFDWDRFKNGEIAVHCDIEGKAKDFLKECKNRNINWCTGRDVTKRNYWEEYKEDTCYCCFDGDSKLGYADYEFYISEGREIIKWEVKEMKELTFKEVIANIKEGEVWESDIKIIKCTNDGNISVRSKIDGKTEIMNFNKCNLYKLQREEYTFEEAFKAYEEGKEIESCEECRFKLIDKDNTLIIDFAGDEMKYSNKTELFSVKEIRGKWYIND